MNMSLSIIVPCFNEEAVIDESYKRISRVLSEMKYLSEIIFINDGSYDKTEQILSSIAKTDSRVKVISFSRNFGHQQAVTAGLNHCFSDMAVIIDADLQDPPELIPDMIRTMNDTGAQVVYCVRKQRKGEGFFKKITAKWFYRMLNSLSEIKLPVDTGDFRLLDKSIIREFNKLHEKGKYIRGLISWIGFKQVPYYYERDPRFAGETKYPLSKMLKLATTSMLYFSTKPLRIATTIGFLSVILAFGLTIWFVLGKILGFTHADTGWTSLFVLITFLGGVQLITIGIIGEYVGNLFKEIKNRPEYIIQKKENFGDDPEKEI
ncbi:MAG: glycosyltransferase family 2 protein [Paludibacter sp.]|nr:glycosyltransferase family 2 protein [Paludibacter sp.]MDD4197948.1 glycosyltransferase family 2 protein [Paludibacter sp.]